MNDKYKDLTDDQLRQRYLDTAHAMQTGVAAMLGGHDQPQLDACSPKHLRVGVNSAMVEHSALVELLIGKGVINEREYMEALVDGFEREVERYRHKIADKLGVDVGRINLSWV